MSGRADADTARPDVPGPAPARRVLVPHAVDPRAPAFGGRVHALTGCSMGTTWSVRLVAAAGQSLVPIGAAIEQTLGRVVAQMSTWDAAADLARFNRAAAGTWHTLPDAFFDVLSAALDVARDSGGAFDPTAGALVNAWGFGPRRRYDEPGFEPPDAAQVAAARAAGGWSRLEVAAETRRIRQPGGLQLDLSAIAKGYAVDQVAQRLRQQFGLEDLLVDVGGELRGHGLKPDGQPWWVALEAPPAAGDDGGAAGALRETWIALHGLCVATSGDYRRCFVRDGVRHAHSIDPRSGWPIAHGLASVTVVHRSCMAADALSTALTVLGTDAGLPWAEQRGLAARFVTRRADGGFDERCSAAFAALAA